MFAKVIYFNWNKARNEDFKSDRNLSPSLMSVTWSTGLLIDRPDLYDYVGDFEVSGENLRTFSYEGVCNGAFRRFNRVEADDMAGLNIRSMSVGDIVLFDDGRLFVVHGMGWKEFSGNFDKFNKLSKVNQQDA